MIRKLCIFRVPCLLGDETMFEQQRILNKIEQWVERLPYNTVKIEIQLPGQTLTLEKDKARPVGFAPPPIHKEGA